MTEIENKKVTTPKAVFTKQQAVCLAQSSVGFPADVPRIAWDEPKAEKHALRSLAVRVSKPASHPRKKMTIKALVMSDRSDEYTGKKGLVKQQIITVMDQSEGERLAQPVEYAMSDEEKAVHAGKLQDKVIQLGIRELLPFGGRLRARGKIVGLVGK
jgi:ribosomal protein S8E